MNNFLSKINNFANTYNIDAIYLVGLNDQSDLSDFDLIIVANKKEHKKIKKELKKLDNKIDLKHIIDIDCFKKTYTYWPYFQMKLIYGKELTDLVEYSEKMKLVKFSFMFFKSFLRNYYRYSLDKDINLNNLLKDLNDFNYCKKYLDDIPESIFILIQKVNEHRSGLKTLDEKEGRVLLSMAIDASWLLIDLLNERLKKEFLIKDIKYLYLGKEPTLIIPCSTNSCRILNEKQGLLFKKSKILYLPSGFSFIFSDDEYVKNFMKINSKFSLDGVISYLKVFIKIIFVVFYYFSYKRYEKKVFN